MNNYSPKSVRNAYWLWIASFFGCLGFHRFYLKKKKTAILWLCTAGFFGIGAIADLFALKWLVKRYNLLEKVRSLETELEEVTAWKDRYARAQRFEEAVEKRDEEQLLKREITELRRELGVKVDQSNEINHTGIYQEH